MKPNLRNFALTAHVAFSVGWLGTVASYLALAITALVSPNPQMVRSAYLAMEVIAWYVIVPFSLASLLMGLIMSLSTNWGLLRHYWVLFKLVLTVTGTIILLLYMPSIDYFAGVAAKTNLTSTDLRELRNPTHVLHSSIALLMLLVTTALSVYKPRGLTAYGWRKQHEKRRAPQP